MSLRTEQKIVPPAHPAPMPSFMSPDQVAQYLSELRAYRTPRPGGARPLDKSQPVATQQSASIDQRRGIPEAQSTTQLVQDASACWSTDDHHMNIDIAVKERFAPRCGDSTLRQSHETYRRQPYGIPYYERGQRWMERQEARSLSRALQEKDLRSQARLHSAAQQEAANLIWKHQNPQAAFPNPEYDFRQHLRQGSHARSQSVGPFQDLYIRKRASIDSVHRSASGCREVSSGSNSSTSTRSSGQSRSFRDRVVNSIKLPTRSLRRSRDYSSVDRGYFKSNEESYTTPFPNPDDRIYEEVEEIDNLATKQDRNACGIQLQIEARNTSYGNNTLGVASVLPPNLGSPKHVPLADPARFRNGIEIRSDDIRAATSMKIKDRSPNLPMPSLVSDLPNRPIISFKASYGLKQPERPLGGIENASTWTSCTSAAPRVTSLTSDMGYTDAQAITTPTIQTDIPNISISSTDWANPPEFSRTTVAVHDYDTGRPNPDPDFKITVRSNLRHRRDRDAPKSLSNRSHWTPAVTTTRVTAQCAACALAIEGKIVTAAGERFHPRCFTCYQCKELLECVAFYPEPEEKRTERLLLLESRCSNNPVNEHDALDGEDYDTGLRFYCHLDFHENFSPRCRNCKTPIEGKVVVACGGEWHEGHFFCAECGDPFDSTTPFIEKNGYAWCVPCHCRRFSGKCAMCRKPIVDVVINALGKEWHENCFCCKKCGSRFADGRFFTPSTHEGPFCVNCEAQRLKA